MTVTDSVLDGDTIRLYWTLQFVKSTTGGASSTSSNRKWTVVVAGSTWTGTYDIDRTGTHTISTGYVDVPRSTADYNVSFSCSMAFNLTWSGTYKGTLSASDTISISAKASYAVTYNANGGSGSITSQTKYHGTALTLKNSGFTRTGYKLASWYSSYDGKTYALGGSYSANAKTTMSAQWIANTYHVVFDANDGSGSMDTLDCSYGTIETLTANAFSKEHHAFKGWATSPNGIVMYEDGASVVNLTSVDYATVTLYAVWETIYIPPAITDMLVGRCDADETPDEEGTYALVYFSWATYYDVTSITIKWKRSSQTTYPAENVVSVPIDELEDTTSGTVVDKIFGNGGLSTDFSYDILVTVADNTGSASVQKTIGSYNYLIDFIKDGVAFNKVADKSGYLDVDFLGLFRKDVTFSGDILIDDPELDLASDEVFAGHLIQNSQNLKHNQSRTSYALGTSCLDEYYTNSTTYWSFKEENGIMVASATASGKTSDLYTYLCTPFVPIAQIPNGVEFSFWLKVDDVSAWDVKVPVQANLIDSEGSRFNYQSPSITHANLNNPNVKSGEWVKIVYTLPMSKLETWTDFTKTAYVAFRLELARNGSIHFKLPDFRAL